MGLQNMITLQKKKSRLSKLSLDAAEYDGEADGIYVSDLILGPIDQPSLLSWLISRTSNSCSTLMRHRRVRYIHVHRST